MMTFRLPLLGITFLEVQKENDYGEYAAVWTYQVGDDAAREDFGLGYCYMNANVDDPKRGRYADIVIVRQKSVPLTIVVLIHELCHAAVWLLHLPDRWNEFINKHLHGHVFWPLTDTSRSNGTESL